MIILWKEPASHDGRMRCLGDTPSGNECLRQSVTKESGQQRRAKIAKNVKGRVYSNQYTFKHPWLPYKLARGKLHNEPLSLRGWANRQVETVQRGEREDFYVSVLLVDCIPGFVHVNLIICRPIWHVFFCEQIAVIYVLDNKQYATCYSTLQR